MGKIKVLIVDDSAVIRKILKDLLSEDPEIEVVGTAANGKLALDQVALLKPDVITLDIEMPEMDGLETVKRIRSNGSTTPIIMCSSLTAHGASHTLDALAFGASDYVTKPSSHGVNTREVVGDDLLKKVKGLAESHVHTAGLDRQPLRGSVPAAQPISHISPATNAIDAIAVGVSTGGPNALLEIVPRLPSNLNVPIFIVQHMPPIFTKLLAERLDTLTKLTVVEAEQGQEVQPGTIYIAPGDFHMEVKRILGQMKINLTENPPENSCRPAVDALFRSIASVYGSKTLAVMLTGMGEDGLRGCQAIKAAGGTIIAQDRESSVVWGMPGAVVEAGLASSTVPLLGIADAIVGATWSSGARKQPLEHRV
jgi:two-component system chemotaxis response regulator CheB